MSEEKLNVSNEEINKVVSAALRKKRAEEPEQNIKEQFRFAGKDYELQFTRRYHQGHVSLCNPASCNAGHDCCHLRKVDGINLCYTGSNDFDLMNYGSEGGLIWGIDEETETNIFKAVRKVLELINESSPKPQENK